MIVTIKGILTHKMPDEIIIEINGLGYACYISTNTYDNLPKPGKEAALLTYFHVTENSQQLFAFSDITERELFMMLIGVSGIGPKTARRIIVELKDKFVKLSADDLPHEDSDIKPEVSDAYDALLALGFKMKDIRYAISTIQSKDKEMGTEEIVKQALTELG